MNKGDITKAVDTLANAVTSEQEARAKLTTADNAYDTELQKWMLDHADLVDANVAAHEKHNAAKEAKTIATKRVREIMPDYFEANPEARNEIPGISYRLERKPVYTPRHFVDAAIEANATFLLQPDEKAIKTFVKGMAIKNKDGQWELPDSIHVWFGHNNLDVANDYVVTISEGKLVAAEDGETT